jgi:hypothetical protein
MSNPDTIGTDLARRAVRAPIERLLTPGMALGAV